MAVGSHWRGLNRSDISSAFKKDNFGLRAVDVLGRGLGGGIVKTRMVMGGCGKWQMEEVFS